jgi:uncharacterized protein (TIGR00255 family)
MAVYSMTGYAGASSQRAFSGSSSANADASAATSAGATPARNASVFSGAVNVELRSVNSRFLDLVFRLPDEFRSIEPALRELLTGAFKRGKIELRLSTQAQSESGIPQPQPEQLNRLARLEGMVQNWLPRAAPLSVHEALTWCRAATPSVDFPDDLALQATKEAIAGLQKARAREGKKLVVVLRERLTRLNELAEAALPLVPATIARHQQKFIERWREALQSVDAGKSIAQEALNERAINEAAAFAIRIDVAEELARLKAHLEEIGRLLDKGGELGKRLDFLIQELLREANTLASKASSLELTNICVEMKVVIEQLREQVQNIE